MLMTVRQLRSDLDQQFNNVKLGTTSSYLWSSIYYTDTSYAYKVVDLNSYYFVRGTISSKSTDKFSSKKAQEFVDFNVNQNIFFC